MAARIAVDLFAFLVLVTAIAAFVWAIVSSFLSKKKKTDDNLDLPFKL